MLFNSFEYLIFLPIVFIIYWFVLKDKIQIQNIFLLIASYFFYGWWDWRFLALIIFSSFVDYYVAKGINKTSNIKVKKRLLGLSLSVNLGLLGVLKYFNFFTTSFHDAFNSIGIEVDSFTINIILPVGISFYTFQTLSYTIDVYRDKLKPTSDIVAFFAFVSFFPQLVAGPIERASNLLPQFSSKRIFNYAKSVDGLRQILWGLFKKIVIADSLATHVNYIFSNSETLPSSMLLLGAIMFAFQIYGDFSGYSDIAIGTAKLFGFSLMQNFAFPYFSRNIAEFWRRWHISLSTWFRDYLYIPLGGSRGGTSMKIRNTIIIFVVSGFWHGANWTFIIWGALNAIYFIPSLLYNTNRKYLSNNTSNKNHPTFREIIQILITFTLTTFAWIFFRAKDITHAISYIKNIFINNLSWFPNIQNVTEVQKINMLLLFLLVIFLIIIEWFSRSSEHGLSNIFKSSTIPNTIFRRLLYFVLILIILLYLPNKSADFIYFQF